MDPTSSDKLHWVDPDAGDSSPDPTEWIRKKDLNGHPSLYRFANDKGSGDEFETADGWKMGRGALYHISGDIAHLFENPMFIKDDLWHYLRFLGEEIEAR